MVSAAARRSKKSAAARRGRCYSLLSYTCFERFSAKKKKICVFHNYFSQLSVLKSVRNIKLLSEQRSMIGVRRVGGKNNSGFWIYFKMFSYHFGFSSERL